MNKEPFVAEILHASVLIRVNIYERNEVFECFSYDIVLRQDERTDLWSAVSIENQVWATGATSPEDAVGKIAHLLATRWGQEHDATDRGSKTPPSKV
jgi:hypothetical protein